MSGDSKTLTHWRRRALRAEDELATLRQIRQQDAQRDLALARELARLRVALREITEAVQWASEGTP